MNKSLLFRILIFAILVIIGISLFYLFQSIKLRHPSSSVNETPISSNDIELPNPASVYCLKQGGKLEIRKDKDEGEYGVCVFSDGTECDEWAFFKGECKKKEVNEGFCGISTFGSCLKSLDCLKAGCSGQICQSKKEEPIITTCEYKDCYNSGKYNIECQCLNRQCQWYKIDE